MSVFKSLLSVNNLQKTYVRKLVGNLYSVMCFKLADSKMEELEEHAIKVTKKQKKKFGQADQDVDVKKII